MDGDGGGFGGEMRTLPDIENSGRTLRDLALAATALLNLSWWCRTRAEHRVEAARAEDDRVVVGVVVVRARENSLDDMKVKKRTSQEKRRRRNKKRKEEEEGPEE